MVDEYFSIKANNLSRASVTRYKEYLSQFNYFFSKYFQTAFIDITLIKGSHIVEFIDYITSRGTSEWRVWFATTANSYRVFLQVFLSIQLKRNI